MLSQTSYLLAGSGDTHVLFPLERVREVMLACALTHPVSDASALEGFLALDEQNLPVLNLSVLLGLPKESWRDYSKFIRLSCSGMDLLLRVEEVPGVLDGEGQRRFAQNEACSFQGCVEAVLQQEGHPERPVLNPDRLLQEAELQWLREWKEQLAERIPAPREASS